MNMRKTFCLLITLLSIFSLAEESVKQELPYKWKKWLEEEVVYIITRKERNMFFSLKSEREREAFKKAFWLQRDPTPGTQTNEFRNEHYRRVKYATEFFGRETFKQGWETDRGRIYIILGEPIDIQRYYETSAELVPTELWQYQGDTSLGLPPFFYIVFFKEGGSDEHKLYSPSFHGPQKLLQATSQRNLGRYQAYQQITEYSAELGEASLSLIPGTDADPYSSIGSISSDILISSIQELPQKKIESEWIDAFVRHKEIITTDYSVNYVKGNSVLFVHQENKKYYVHTIIEPYRTSMSQFDDKIYAPLKLNIKISDLSGKTIYQHEKNIDIEMSLDDFKKIERRLVATGFVTPIVEGNFTINYLLRNIASKEFSSLEETVYSRLSEMPSLSPILFLYDAKKVPKKLQTIAFLFHDHQLFPNTRKLYTKADELIIYFEVYNPSMELEDCAINIAISGEEKLLLNHKERIGNQTYFLKKFPLLDYKAGYYKARVSVTDNTGKEIMTERGEFTLSPVTRIPRPWNVNRIYPPLYHPYFSLIRANQYLGLGKDDLVIQEIEKFHDKESPQKPAAEMLARAYFNKSDYQKVIEILDPLKDIQDLEIIKLIGKSYFQLKDYESAIDYFKKALITGGEIIEILNLLGYSYFKTNDTKEALKYLKRSLKLNSNQPNIKKIIEKIKKGD